MSVELSIIIVSWNVVSLLGDCLRSIFGASGESSAVDVPYEVYVVDNASSDGTTDMVRREFPQVKLIANPANLGFTAANNIALRRCQGRYIMLLNPDTRIVGDALKTMLGYMRQHADVGVVGPQLRYADGTLQSSRRRFPTLMTALFESTLLQQWFPRNRWAQRYYVADMPDDKAQDVDWVTGACMLARSEVISRVGLLDESFFMYSEELDWCRRIRAAGWRVVYLPEAVVIHYEGRSSGQVVAARHIHFESSKVYYFRKHHGLAQAEFLRAFLLLTYVFRLAEDALKYAVDHKRELRGPRIKAYLGVLRSGLRLAPRPAEGSHG